MIDPSTLLTRGAPAAPGERGPVIDEAGQVIGDAVVQDDGQILVSFPHEHRWISSPELGSALALQLCATVGCDERRHVGQADA